MKADSQTSEHLLTERKARRILCREYSRLTVRPRVLDLWCHHLLEERCKWQKWEGQTLGRFYLGTTTLRQFANFILRWYNQHRCWFIASTHILDNISQIRLQFTLLLRVTSYNLLYAKCWWVNTYALLDTF